MFKSVLIAAFAAAIVTWGGTCAAQTPSGSERATNPSGGSLVAPGFAKGTTGGGAGIVCQWRDQPTLESCVRGSEPTVAVAVGNPTVVATAKIMIGSNKTILGPARITASHLIMMEIREESNIIIRNIGFTSQLADACLHQDESAIPATVKGCGIPINIIDQSTHVWIDQDDFSRCGEKCVEIWSLGPGRTPDAITISNSRFSDSYFCAAIGVNARAMVPPPGSERVTIIGNTFDHCFRRSVRAASGAWVAEIGNTIRDWGPAAGACGGRGYGFGPSAVGAAQLLLRNNTFIAGPVCKEAVQIADYRPKVGEVRGMGFVRAEGNVMVNGATVGQNQPDTVFALP